MSNPEIFKGSESTSELEKAAGEQLEKLKLPELSTEQSPESRVERADSARTDAKEVFAKEASKEREQQASAASPRAIRRGRLAQAARVGPRHARVDHPVDVALPHRTL